jgi:hypothetical protein
VCANGVLHVFDCWFRLLRNQAMAQMPGKRFFTERCAYANERRLGRDGDYERTDGVGKGRSIKGPSATE